MYNGTIRISGVDDARSFVAMTTKYPKLKIMLNSREYIVDAHSIIGILSLDLSQPIALSAEGEGLDEFVDDLKPFTV